RGGQDTGVANLIDGVDSIPAAALSHEQRVVENRQPAIVVVLSRLICGCISNLANIELADHLRNDWGRTGYQQLGASRMSEVQADLRACQLRGTEASIVVISSEVVITATFNGGAAIVSAVGVSVRGLDRAQVVHFNNGPVISRRNRIC